MLFNSFEFLVFLPIVFLLYWFVFRGRQWQNLLVVVASYLFYGWWDWRFLLLIALTSLCSYGSGILLEHYEGQRRKQRLVSASNIVLNLGILGVFKYYNFFVENLDNLLGTLGWQFVFVFGVLHPYDIQIRNKLMKLLHNKLLVIIIPSTSRNASQNLVLLNRKYAQQVEQTNYCHCSHRPQYWPHHLPQLLFHIHHVKRL